jgi:flavin reductase (DIM6/NTAB) family NADH-FMN oxidoreductase RutF
VNVGTSTLGAAAWTEGCSEIETLPCVDNALFRCLMGSLMSGVNIVTTVGTQGKPFGMTCSAVCSLSPDPPLLLACIGTPSATLDAIQVSRRFVVNVLDAESNDISNWFASRTPDKFGKVSWQFSELTGMPILDATVARAECTVYKVLDAGDHMIVIGLIVGGDAKPDRFPLGYWRGSYVRAIRVRRSR